MERLFVVLLLPLLVDAAAGAATVDPAATPGAVIAAADAAAPAAAPPALDPEQLARLVAGAQAGLGGTVVKPAPPTLELHRGVTEAIPIGLRHLNRFRTPFRELRIETTSEAQIKKEGGSFYVATDGPEPVTLFLIDKDNPDNAVSLLLKPYELPPADVRLELPWATLKPPAPGRDAAAPDPRQPYVAHLTQLFRELAQGRIPAGYRIDGVDDRTDPAAPCDFAGLRVEPLQRIDGTTLDTVVARVSNPGHETLAIDEAACAGPAVLAVAAWPLVELGPGDETELFIAVRPSETVPANARPSVLHPPSR